MCSLRFEFEDNWTKRTGVLWRPFWFQLNPLKQDLVLLCFFGLFGVIGRCWLQDSQWHPRDPSNNHTLSHAARKINKNWYVKGCNSRSVSPSVLSVHHIICTKSIKVYLAQSTSSIWGPKDECNSPADKAQQNCSQQAIVREDSDTTTCNVGSCMWWQHILRGYQLPSNSVIVLFYPYVHSWDSVIGRNRRSKWAGRWKNMLEKPSDSTVWQCY